MIKKTEIGMSYSDVSRRCKRIMSSPGHPESKRNLINSLANQCRLSEGEKALHELDTELSSLEKRPHSFSGDGNKQIGWGNGKRLGEGTWRYQDGSWVKI